MGFISSYSKNQTPPKGVRSLSGRSQQLWDEVFGNASKEKPAPRPQQDNWQRPQGYRSIAGYAASQARLIEALRSDAPGGWTTPMLAKAQHLLGAVYIGVTRLCRHFSQCEFQVFKRDPNAPKGKRPITEADPPDNDYRRQWDIKPYDLVKLLQKPNKQDSWGMLMWRLLQQKLLEGMALTWLLPNQTQTPMELYVLPTALCVPQPSTNPDFPFGFWRVQPYYPYGPFSSYPTPNSAVGASVPAQWVMKSMYPHPLVRYEGWSPQDGMRLEIDEFEMIGKSRHSTMRKGVRPSAVLNFDEVEGAQSLTSEEIARIHAEWENTYQGYENDGGLIVGVPGGRLDQFGISPREMDFTQGYEQLLSVILGGGFGITKPAAGMVEDSAYSTLFATMKQLYTHTLDPECNDIGSDLTRDVAPHFGDDLIVELRCKPINDHEIMFKKADLFLQTGRITWNQLCKLVDEDELITQQPWGDMTITELQAEDQMKAQQMQMMMQAQMMGQAPGGAPGQGGPAMSRGVDMPPTEGAVNQAPDLAAMVDEMRAEPSEVMNSRPQVGELAQGALGPRKRLEKLLKKRGLGELTQTKSMYDQVREACERNGSH